MGQKVSKTQNPPKLPKLPLQNNHRPTSWHPPPNHSQKANTVKLTIIPT